MNGGDNVMVKKEKVKTQYTQGDVFLEECEKIPNTAKPSNNLVLAEGETTGHKHVLQGKTIQVFREPGEGRVFVKTDVGTVLVHEEHAPIQLKKGLFEVKRQAEYTPVGMRQVQD
jgi:hypothetical protein